jgi:MFS family permease
VALLFQKRATLAGGRALPLVATLFALGCTAMAIYSSAMWLVIVSGTLLNLAIGVLSGCYLTGLATDIPQQRRGLVFGGAYAFGSLGTWLISLPIGGRFLWHSGSFFAVAVLALASLLLVKRLEPPTTAIDGEYERTGFGKKLILLAAAVLLLLSMENMLGFAFPLGSAQDSVYIEFTRVFYGVGLVVAGFVSDKNRRRVRAGDRTFLYAVSKAVRTGRLCGGDGAAAACRICTALWPLRQRAGYPELHRQGYVQCGDLRRPVYH